MHAVSVSIYISVLVSLFIPAVILFDHFYLNIGLTLLPCFSCVKFEPTGRPSERVYGRGSEPCRESDGRNMHHVTNYKPMDKRTPSYNDHDL
jgi:hypothetical protein